MKDVMGPLAVHGRWLVRRDLPEAVAIDAAGFGPAAWGEEDFLAHLRHRARIGSAAEIGGRVVAFCVYELRERELGILRLAVHPRWRRRGVGGLVVAWLARKLSGHRRTSIEALVPERMLEAQLFLRSCGFRWERTEKSSGGDSYSMRLRLPGKED